ncbi:hypothetical protein BC826DRAFT_1114196 [Russula brevipes]|nr:hypothetical protein BC826DRAFT_1114196 [Russula brevipes]
MSGGGGGGGSDDLNDPMPSIPPPIQPLDRARARPPTSGGGGGGDGDDLGAWATNVRLHHLGPLKKDEDNPMPSVPPHRSDPSTARAAHPPTSGGGGGGDGDDLDAELESLEMPAPSSPAASQVGSLFSDALSNLSSASSRSGSFSPLYFNHSLVISIRGMGGIHDNAWPPPRRHPLALANAWGVYDNVRHHATLTPRTRKRVGGNIRRCPAATPPTPPRARKCVGGVYNNAHREPTTLALANTYRVYVTTPAATRPPTPAPHARKCMGGI